MQKSKHPLVKNNLLVIDPPGGGGDPGIQIGSQQWYSWLDYNDRFVYEGFTGHFLAQRETRRGNAYWYAYRRRNKKLSKTYLGRAEELTLARLEQASLNLSGKMLLERLSTGLSDEILAPKEAWEDISILPLTKVRPPALPSRLVQRPRLTRQINKAVTILFAPSGLGKSTLLNEWRQSCEMPVAWVTLDQDDNQPVHFWTTILSALQTVNLKVGQDLIPLLRSASPQAPNDFASQLSNEMIQKMNQDSLPHRFGLVLDDFHSIQKPEILKAVQSWLENLPPGMQLILAGTTKPPLTLGHLRARGMLIEFNAADLRFTMDEGIDFLEQYTREQPLSYSDMEKLVNRTEGWAAGLNLAVLALSKQSDPHSFVETFDGTHSYLSDFFKENILYKQSAEVQSFLIKTSILKHLTGSLCDAVTGEAGGSDILAQLWQENLFITRLDEKDWYRYHELFAEMLQEQLRIQFGGEIETLHRKAAEWYRTQDVPADAVFHLLAIKAWEEAAALIESMALRELKTFGEDSRLLRWLQQLPESVVRRHKNLLFVYVRLARLAISASEVERFLNRIESSILENPEGTAEEKEVLAEIQRVRQTYRLQHPTPEQLELGDETDPTWRLTNSLLLTQPAYCPDNIESEVIAREIYEAARAQNNVFMMLMAGSGVASRALYQGHVRRAEKFSQKLLQQVYALRGTFPEPTSITLSVLSHIFFLRNQPTQAHHLLLRAAQTDPNPISTNMPIMIDIQRAKILVVQGNPSAALATIQAARELNLQRPSGIWKDPDLTAYHALIYARVGGLQSAEQLINEASEGQDGPLIRFVRGEILLRQKFYPAAEEVLQELLRLYPCGFHEEVHVRYRIMLAAAQFYQHKIHQAMRLMLETLHFSAPERMLRPFLDYGPECLPLYATLLNMQALSPECDAFLREILKNMDVDLAEITKYLDYDLDQLSTAATISLREQEILKLLRLGLSNREIAVRLSIAESTVKTHLSNIYGKLGANSRVQAVTQAQALKIV